MRFPFITTKTLTAWLMVLAGGAFFTQPIHADIMDPPLPEALPNDDPLQDHTAQDGPMTDHTAQDDADPTPEPPGKDPPRWEKPTPPIVTPHRGDWNDPFNPDADPFVIPILDQAGIGASSAPDMHDFVGGPVHTITLFNQLDFDNGPSERGFNSPTIGTSAVPTPGVLVVIGLGGLALRGRRRR